MLHNAPTLTIGGVGTAESGPSKVRHVTDTIRCNILSDPWSFGRSFFRFFKLSEAR